MLCSLIQVFLLPVLVHSQSCKLADITQPGDPNVSTSSNGPGVGGPFNALDNDLTTKYLNFDIVNTGFTVFPQVGLSTVHAITLTSADDAPDRDPTSYTLAGSYDGSNFTMIASGPVPPFPTRFHKHTILFTNSTPYLFYRVIFPTINGSACCMQIAEVELLGFPAPPDVTQPDDLIVPTSANSPDLEGVRNAIDNQLTKYVVFDTNAGFTITPSLGTTILSGLAVTSAFDSPDRDPTAYALSGSVDGANFFPVSSGSIPPFPGRNQTNFIFFSSGRAYTSYRLVFPAVSGSTCCMQIAEVQLLGTVPGQPRDVTTPGDPIIASGHTSIETTVHNAIDDQPTTKYANFDIGSTGFAVTPGIGTTVLNGFTLTSADNAPEADPTSYALSGSIDGTNFVEISRGTIPPFPTRLHKQSIYFPDHRQPFDSYRLIFPTVNGSTCCVQIAEVELLGTSACSVRTNPVNNLIQRQPQDAITIEGAQATFRVTLTGLWRVQWYRNGVQIPGATSNVYQTPVISPADDGALYQAVVHGYEGMQQSDEVMLSVFRPSPIETIGISFEGEGANATPTPMFPFDVAGFHLQAYWNNITDHVGWDATLVNSSNHPTLITLTHSTSGEWGVGTGEDYPTQRLLNGLVVAFSTNEATAQTLTLNHVPQGSHSLLVYTIQVPLESFNMDFSVVTHDAAGVDVVQRRYIRPQNADEFNASPGYVLVTAQIPEARAVGNMLRFDDIQPGPDGFVQLRFYSPSRFQPPGAEPIRGPGVNGLQLLLNPGAVLNPPLLTILRHTNQVVLSWSQNAAGYTLEASPTLANPTWSRVAAGSNYRYALTNPAATRFFRLRTR